MKTTWISKLDMLSELGNITHSLSEAEDILNSHMEKATTEKSFRVQFHFTSPFKLFWKSFWSWNYKTVILFICIWTLIISIDSTEFPLTFTPFAFWGDKQELTKGSMRQKWQWDDTNIKATIYSCLFFTSSSTFVSSSLPKPFSCSRHWQQVLLIPQKAQRTEIRATMLNLQFWSFWSREKEINASNYFFQLLLWLNLLPSFIYTLSLLTSINISWGS